LREERLDEPRGDRAVRPLEDACAEREPLDLRPPRAEAERELPFARALPSARDRPLEREPEAAARPRVPVLCRLEEPAPAPREEPAPAPREEPAPRRPEELPDRPALEPRREPLAPRREPFDCVARAELPRLAALLRRCFCSNVSG